jgi:superfamily II RNA helicase
LLRLQEHHDVVVPVWWEPDLMGVVKAWAEGESWSDLIANTSLDEGDVVRLMRRTVDLLAQLPYCPAISEELRRNGRRALQMINRFPVKENLPGVEADGLNPATKRVVVEGQSDG